LSLSNYTTRRICNCWAYRTIRRGGKQVGSWSYEIFASTCILVRCLITTPKHTYLYGMN